jgi:hypothetical protein
MQNTKFLGMHGEEDWGRILCGEDGEMILGSAGTMPMLSEMRLLWMGLGQNTPK